VTVIPRSILVIDDERGIRSLVSDVLRRVGHAVDAAETGEAGLEAAQRTAFDLVFCDINLPGMDGLTVLERLLAGARPPPVILITAYPSVETAVRGMKLGARDYITKPFTPDELRLVAKRALDEDELRRQNRELREQLAYADLIGRSPAMAELRSTIRKVARSDATVLLTGESGTGKELVARALHYEGNRTGRPFVPVNCGALVGTLLESELFGHVRGAFTGAEKSKRGLFVAADSGTLFLDEIGELPRELQPKLLRALQEGEIKPVGGVEPEKVDTRVVAATNRDLRRLVADASFREDLFYRLAVITIEVPPLRDRKDDVALLAGHFAERAAARSGAGRVEISEAALAWLEAQPWPGNIRELENAVERAVVLASRAVLEIDDFRPRASAGPAPTTDPAGDRELCSLDELERLHIERVLEVCQGQKTKAATILGINRTTLWKKLRQYGVE
jgi:DNA-binding NtrC family response regulator